MAVIVRSASRVDYTDTRGHRLRVSLPPELSLRSVTEFV